MKTTSQFLTFERIKYHFIYDFIFSTNDKEWAKSNALFYIGIPQERMGWIPSKLSSKIINNQKFAWIEYNSVFKKSDDLKSDEKQSEQQVLLMAGNDNVPVKISILVRLKKKGLGTVTIILEKDNSTTYDELGVFARLIPTTWNQVKNNKFDEDDQSTRDFVAKIEQNGESHTLQHVFFKVLKKLADNGIIKQLDIEEEGAMFGHLRPNKFAELADISIGNDYPHPKTVDPYVHFAGKLSHKVYDKLFIDYSSKNKENEELTKEEYFSYVKQIASILFRFFDLEQHQFMSMDYLVKEFDFSTDKTYPKIVSNNVNSQYFSYIHRMSSVSLYHKDKGIPYELIDKSLNDMLENARSKLKGLNQANFELDTLIDRLSNFGTSYNAEGLAGIFTSLINIQRFAVHSLADLSTLLYDGQVAYDIIELVYDKLNVKSLNNSVFDKITIVRNLIEDYRTFERFDELKKIDL